MDLLRVTSDEKIQIMKLYNITEDRVKKDIELIKIWKSKQPHLQGNLSDDFIEKLLLKNKFSVERCKEKIENYYTIRGANIDLLQDFEKIVPSEETSTCLPMPHITPHFERILIMKLTDPDLSIYNVPRSLKLGLAISEIMLRYDGSIGCRIIIDYQNISLKHVATWNPVLILRYCVVAEKAYSIRIMGIEFVNCPAFINKIFPIFKIFLRPKIYDRIRLHENLESLYKVVPREFLPSDYGGTESNVINLLGKWDIEIKKQKNFLLDCMNHVVNEDLRPPETKENDLFGIGGTFKKLSLD